MKSLHDLSRTLVNNDSVYPGDPSCDLNEIKTVSKDGYSDFMMSTGMHVGTHVDAPSHFIQNSKLISDFPISKFVGNAICFDVCGIQNIGSQHIQIDLINKNDTILFFTGYNLFYGQEKYYTEHPVLTEELAYALVQKEVNMIGLDMPSPDYSPFLIHQILLSIEVLIIENLTNLKSLPFGKRMKIWALPTSIKASAAWVRVVVGY